ncbi:MAG: ABC transporter substrate-binding protein [Rhizobiaceae bacterium]
MKTGVSKPTRRSVLGLGAGAVAGLALPSIIAKGYAKSGPDTINLQLSWIPNRNQLGDIVAKQLGYFEEEGLDFRLQAGGPNNNGIPIVVSGQYEVGEIAGSTNLMLAAAQGLPLRGFAAGLQKHPFAFLSKSENPVKKAADFRGKKVGLSITSVIQLQGVLKLNGIDPKEVEIIPIGSDFTPLLTGHVDVVSAWLSNTTAIKKLGPGIEKLSLWDTGVKLYANVYYATPETLATKAELLARFTKAVARGWGFAHEHPDKAVDLLIKEIPSLDAADELDAAKVILAHSFNEDTARLGWGTMDPERWQKEIDLAASLGQLPHSPALEEVVTFSVLKATTDSRPKLA